MELNDKNNLQLNLSGTLSPVSSMSGALTNKTLRGYSAYQLAVLSGFEGTLEEWLEGLNGDEIQIRNNDYIIEWKYDTETDWKFLIDLSFVKDYNDLINKPTINGIELIGDVVFEVIQSDWNITDSTSDAYIKNKPDSLPANGGNADTVNGHTVDSDVPGDAKFTDTVYTHPNSGVIAGIYKSVSVDEKGHVTSGTNPTTLDGYGITDAAPMSDLETEISRAAAKENEISNDLSNEVTRAITAENNLAPKDSPDLTGTPTAPTASAGTNTTQIATTAFVQTAVSSGIAASDAMIIKGTIGVSGTVTVLPTTYKTGWTYRVVTDGTYSGHICEIGDLIIALVDRNGSGNADSDWCVAQTNINGAITGIKSGDVYIQISQSGSVITITHKDVTRSDTTSAVSPSHGELFTAVKSVISDTKGHVTGVDTETITLPVYSNATQSVSGLESASDKTKLDGIESGAQVNTITGVKGNSESLYRTGNVNITPANIGLGNVPNVATNNQTPTYTESSTLEKLTSGEKLSVAFGKISKAITDFIAHIGDTVKHISSSERTNWNKAYTHSQSNHAPVNAEENQNAFSSIVVGSTTISADSKSDSLEFSGNNVTITPDSANDKVTIGITKDNVISALGYTPGSSIDSNTTYTLSKSGSTITLTGSDGSKTSVEDANTDTTYSAGTGLSLSGTTFNHSNSVTAGTAQGDASKTLAFGGTFTIPTVTYDAQGHITGKGTTTMTMPANPNTDTKVTQTATTSNASYPLLLAPSGQTSTATTTSYFDSGVTLNPSTNTIVANISGNASSATKATQDSAGQQINTTYIKELSVSGTTITYTKGNGTTGTITTQDTNTWRGIQNNLTSTSTTDSLSANQGKVLKDLVDTKATGSGLTFTVVDGILNVTYD